jgi:hypothetical protein
MWFIMMNHIGLVLIQSPKMLMQKMIFLLLIKKLINKKNKLLK